MALADWMMAHYRIEWPRANGLASSPSIRHMRVLKVNEAGQLTRHLATFGEHILGTCPEVDMQTLRFDSISFDLVIHSDTLEHVLDPVPVLRECRRVLKPGGACAFTVRMMVGRMTRSTANGLPTYHGHSRNRSEDLRVRTEFGADTWRSLAAAGFRELQDACPGVPSGRCSGRNQVGLSL
jgi:SAM-dependent methyltransferase